MSKAVPGVVAPPPGSKAAAGVAKESTAPHPHFQEQGMSGSHDRGAAAVACIHVNNLSADWGCTGRCKLVINGANLHTPQVHREIRTDNTACKIDSVLKFIYTC